MTITMTEVGHRAGRAGAGLLIACSLALALCTMARAAEDQPQQSAVAVQAKSFAAAVKRDSQVVGAKCKEGAHRVAVAAKAVAHEVATAAKRGAAQTRAAFRGEKTDSAAAAREH